jgi:uncharacterized protein with GYD domain
VVAYRRAATALIMELNRQKARRVNMAIFIMMTTLTDEGRKTIKANPQRIKEVNKEVEAKGIKILSQYAVLGQYDFVNILDAPSNEAVARLALELGSRGTLQTNTMAAIDLDEFVQNLKK